jgi:hypothetical protein
MTPNGPKKVKKYLSHMTHKIIIKVPLPTTKNAKISKNHLKNGKLTEKSTKFTEIFQKTRNITKIDQNMPKNDKTHPPKFPLEIPLKLTNSHHISQKQLKSTKINKNMPKIDKSETCPSKSKITQTVGPPTKHPKF